VVLLTPSELDPTMKLILQVPIWAARVIYIQGSALKDSDLSRCRSVSRPVTSKHLVQGKTEAQGKFAAMGQHQNWQT